MVDILKHFKSLLNLCSFLVPLRPIARLRRCSCRQTTIWCVQLLFRICWVVHLVRLQINAVNWSMNSDSDSIGMIVGVSLFVGNAAVGVLIIVESCWKRQEHDKFLRLQHEADMLIAKCASRECRASNHLLFKLLLLLCVQIACDVIRVLVTLHWEVSPVFWISFPHMYLLRGRYMQLILHIMKLNERATVLRSQLLELAALNAPKSFLMRSTLWQPYSTQEYDRLNLLRLIYNRVFESYEAFNNCYGWGVLALFLISFFDFVCNAYWTLTSAIKSEFVYLYVYNAATTLSLGSLIATLFWYSNEGVNNLHLKSKHFTFNMSLLNATTKTRLKLFSARLIHKTLDCVLACFALKPCKRCHLLNQIKLCLWLLWLVSATVYATRHTYASAMQFSIGGTVSLTLFFFQMMAHAAILLETLLKRKVYQDTQQQQLHISRQLCGRNQRNQPLIGTQIQQDIAWLIVGITLPLIFNHAIVAWSVLKYSTPPVALYWYSLPSELALQLKLISLLAEIVLANLQLEIVQLHLHTWGECNWQTLYGAILGSSTTLLLQLNDHEIKQQLELAQTQQLLRLKCVYSEIYCLFEQLNAGHGVSLLAISIVFFLDFVCNAYWVFGDILSHVNDFYAFVQNTIFMLNVVVLLTAICWHCQRSYNYSRYIGCLICKLVKPLGNKRYNDLVSEFLLQTLHQRFVITAKDFFSLNLHLLGSMFAAIVTYLVILIQFMFAEKSAKERAKGITNTTTTTTS